ncbi:hypothetical protein C1X17_30200, partial [Pseudomonas sp. FW305-3-2-15-C-TSA2]|uniref:cyclomaltodextrinase C-terminal domain-containing protein n=1 Tax=Pseudomonas sp. FW305-3-2-15-C-TSA2 TaxID=2751334 RepID=UPI000CB42220
AYPALRRGEQYVRWSDPNGAGMYAFSRIYQGQEVLVVINTSGQPRDGEMWMDEEITPGGAALEDALDPGYGLVAQHGPTGGTRVSVAIPPYG